MPVFPLLIVLVAKLAGIDAVCIPSCQRFGRDLETCDQRAGGFNCAHLEGHQGCWCKGCRCLTNIMQPPHIPVKSCREFRSSSSCQANRVACKWWKLGSRCIGKNEQPAMSCAPSTITHECTRANVREKTTAG